MTERADILFYVQHLLGIGHLRRAAAIVRALDAAGTKVLFVSGGVGAGNFDVGAARLVQLPPLQSLDEHFSCLVDEHRNPVDEAWKSIRAAQLLEVFETALPRIVVTEMFPFGRRQMRFELLPLLDAAVTRCSKPAIVCSVRDILNEPRNAKKTRWMVDTLNRYFDRVLVHGDPEVVCLDATFPALAEVRPDVAYTGYVVTEAPGCADTGVLPERPGDGDVLVSAGGGRAVDRGSPCSPADGTAFRGALAHPGRPAFPGGRVPGAHSPGCQRRDHRALAAGFSSFACPLSPVDQSGWL